LAQPFRPGSYHLSRVQETLGLEAGKTGPGLSITDLLAYHRPEQSRPRFMNSPTVRAKAGDQLSHGPISA
jgi:hypothetical protein